MVCKVFLSVLKLKKTVGRSEYVVRVLYAQDSIVCFSERSRFPSVGFLNITCDVCIRNLYEISGLSPSHRKLSYSNFEIILIVC
jgi:hypothetical protein